MQKASAERRSRLEAHQHVLCRASESHDADVHARLTRLTNAFSKKIENHMASVALHCMYSNFVRIHQTLRATPAMAAGFTGPLWPFKALIRSLGTKRSAVAACTSAVCSAAGPTAWRHA